MLHDNGFDHLKEGVKILSSWEENITHLEF